MKPLDQLKVVTQGYLAAIDFTGLGPDCEFESRTFADTAVLKAAAGCAEFMQDCLRPVLKGLPLNLLELYLETQNLEQLGHDFWLTRNRHGTGFWDRGTDVGGDLSELAKSIWGANPHMKKTASFTWSDK